MLTEEGLHRAALHGVATPATLREAIRVHDLPEDDDLAMGLAKLTMLGYSLDSAAATFRSVMDAYRVSEEWDELARSIGPYPDRQAFLDELAQLCDEAARGREKLR